MLGGLFDVEYDGGAAVYTPPIVVPGQPRSLRDYQVECKDAVLTAYDAGCRSMLCELACGLGKTVIFSSLIFDFHQRLGSRRRRWLVLAHHKELLDQAEEKLAIWAPGLKVGIERGHSRADRDCDAVLASVDTIGQLESERLQWLADEGVDGIVTDECHRSAAATYKRVYERFCVPDVTLMIGFTATPDRLDGQPIYGPGGVFERKVYSYGLLKGIRAGYLCDIRGICVDLDIDWDDVSIVGEEFDKREMAALMNTPQVRKLFIDAWFEHGGRMQTIGHCLSVEQAETYAEEMRRYGVRAEANHSKRSAGDLTKIERAFRAGELDWVLDCGKWRVGFDHPPIGCAWWLYKTASMTNLMQGSLRAGRPHESKEYAVVCDTYGWSKTKRLTGLASLIGAPAHINMQGATVTELSDAIEDVPEMPRERWKYQPRLSFSDIRATISSVDLLTDVKTPDEVSEVSKFKWVELPREYLCEFTKSRAARLRRDKAGEYHIQLTGTVRGKFGDVLRQALGVYDLKDAIKAADTLIIKTWKDCHPSYSITLTDKQLRKLYTFGYRKDEVDELSIKEANKRIYLGNQGVFFGALKDRKRAAIAAEIGPDSTLDYGDFAA